MEMGTNTRASKDIWVTTRELDGDGYMFPSPSNTTSGNIRTITNEHGPFLNSRVRRL